MSGIIKPGPVPRCDAFCNECTDRSLGSGGSKTRGTRRAYQLYTYNATLPAKPTLYIHYVVHIGKIENSFALTGQLIERSISARLGNSEKPITVFLITRSVDDNSRFTCSHYLF